jgi:hypothetical protein
VKNGNGSLLSDYYNSSNRWKNYFTHLLNVHSESDIRKIEICIAETLVPDPSPFKNIVQYFLPSHLNSCTPIKITYILTVPSKLSLGSPIETPYIP